MVCGEVGWAARLVLFCVADHSRGAAAAKETQQQQHTGGTHIKTAYVKTTTNTPRVTRPHTVAGVGACIHAWCAVRVIAWPWGRGGGTVSGTTEDTDTGQQDKRQTPESHESNRHT